MVPAGTDGGGNSVRRTSSWDKLNRRASRDSGVRVSTAECAPSHHSDKKRTAIAVLAKDGIRTLLLAKGEWRPWPLWRKANRGLSAALLLLLLLCRRGRTRRLRLRRALLGRLRRLGRRLHLGRREDQVQGVALLPRAEFHDTFVANIFDEPFKDLASQPLARHFTAAKEDGGFHLVTLAKEAQHVVFLGLVVVIVHVDAELHFLDRELVLVLFGFTLALF